jgi:hypothetical protein
MKGIRNRWHNWHGSLLETTVTNKNYIIIITTTTTTTTVVFFQGLGLLACSGSEFIF